MSEPLIECRGVTKRFGDVVAVGDVNLRLMPGEVLSILGASGCGKTTLLRIIAGFEAVDGGELYLRSSLVSDTNHHMPPERRNIGMVFQEYALFPHLTVSQNVAFGLQGMSKGEQQRRTQDALELVRLNALEARYPHELSGGQQQRVALARTLAPSPIAMLLD
ncbi:MAG: ABC transporter ATP-binding protein, partial [Chloroflexi bacterium]|nr:ABC transporter ATP-binding protein [Chloroflexota bacterium]